MRVVCIVLIIHKNTDKKDYEIKFSIMANIFHYNSMECDLITKKTNKGTNCKKSLIET